MFDLSSYKLTLNGKVEEEFKREIVKLVDESNLEEHFRHINREDFINMMSYFLTTYEGMIVFFISRNTMVWTKRALRACLGDPDRTVGDTVYYNRMPIAMFNLDSPGMDNTLRGRKNTILVSSSSPVFNVVQYDTLGLETEVVSPMKHAWRSLHLDAKDITKIVTSTNSDTHLTESIIDALFY